jgi:phosphohistidine phosphatase
LDTRWNEYLTSLKRFQKVASVKNVHDLRVSSRRLTTTIDLIDRFNPDNMLRQARSKLKQQLSELSVLRDVHVEMVGIRGFLKQLPEMKGFYAELRGRERKCLKSVTKIAWKSDCRFIENAVNRAKIRLNARRATTREENSRKIIETALDVSFDNLSKKLESVIATDFASIHRVRLAFKPVRYTLEMLQPLLGLDSKKLRTAALLARSMGQIQDLEVLMKDLVEFKWRKESVLGAVTEIWLDLERRKTEATQRYLRSIPKFGNIWKPIIHEHTGVTPAPSKTLLILRHGIAVARGDPAYPLDSDRPLTPKGVRRMRRIANGMRRSKVGFDVILTSPYRRALETAFIVGREYSVGQTIQTMSGLRPEVLPAEAIRALQERYSPYRRLLLVGHEPQLSAMVSTLTTGSASARPLLKKGSLCKLEVERLQIGKCAKLLWLLTPRQLINSA